MGDVLFLAHRAPFPPDRGDKIRSYHLLRYLAARARVHLIAFADDERDLAQADALAGIAASVTLIRRRKSRARAVAEALVLRRPVSLTAFHDPSFTKAVAGVLARAPVESIFAFSGQMAQYVPARAQQRVVMDFVDVDSAKFGAYARTAPGPMRWMLEREQRCLFAHERAVAARVHASLFVSEAEAELFRAQAAADRIAVVENGIDTRAFSPAAEFSPLSPDGRGPLIVFTGQMDYPPNAEGAAWFAEQVWPAVLAAHPAARFAIVGRAPTRDVRALTGQAGVTVTGEVADVRPWLAAARLAVAPLRTARGVQNKVLEGMAMARAVIVTDAAAEGIDHAGTIAVAGDADAMAACVNALLANPAAADRLGSAARERVEARYGWEARLAPLDALLGLGHAERLVA